MDKISKLQRYDRKQYDALVDFPVEIVGRDGVVRRYGFEDSVRLYQRRIGFAAVRFADPELRRAEVSHCRARIDQLRRSFYRRHGWGTAPGEPDAEDLFGDLAGELAAFLVRFLRCEGRPELRFQPVEQRGAGGSTWYVTPAGMPSGMLLDVHRFDAADDGSAHERFFAALRRRRLVTLGEGDGEELLAFHHTADCGFVLTGRAADFAHIAHVEPELEADPTPWDTIGLLVRRGEHEEALRASADLVRVQPWHRRAYLGGALLALALDKPLEAEALALLGRRYFPDDAEMRLQLGLARWWRGEGVDDVREALAADPGLADARLVLAMRAAALWRPLEALRLLRDAEVLHADDRRGRAALRRFGDDVRQAAWVGLLAAGLLATGAVATWALGWPGLVALGLGAALLVSSSAGLRQAARDGAARYRRELPRRLRRLHGSGTVEPPVH